MRLINKIEQVIVLRDRYINKGIVERVYTFKGKTTGFYVNPVSKEATKLTLFNGIWVQGNPDKAKLNILNVL